MNTRKVVFLGVIMVAMAAITVPLISFSAGAAGTAAKVKALSAAKANAAAATRTTAVEVKEAQPQSELAAVQEAGGGRIADETLKALGIKRLSKGASRAAASKSIARKITKDNPGVQVQASLPPGTGPGGASAIPVPGAPKCRVAEDRRW